MNDHSEHIYFHKIGDILHLDGLKGPERVISRNSGSFGTIYELENIAFKSKENTIVKTIRKEYSNSQELLDEFRSEIQMWVNLPLHPFILPGLIVYSINNIPYIRTPLIKGYPDGNNLALYIASHTNRKEKISSSIILTIVTELLSAINYLNEKIEGFVHGDVKPENILMKSQEIIKLTDFGHSKSASLAKPKLHSGDYCYIAPEIAKGATVNQNTDIYSIGATIFEIVFGHKLHCMHHNDQHTKYLYSNLSSYTKNLPRYTSYISKSIESMQQANPYLPVDFFLFLNKCLEINHNKRWKNYNELVKGFIYFMNDPQLEEMFFNTNNFSTLNKTDDPDVMFLINNLGINVDKAYKINEELIKASQFRHINQFGKCDKIINKLLIELPSFPPVLESKAHSLSKQGMLKEALIYYNNARDIYNSLPSFKNTKIKTYAIICDNIIQIMALTGDFEISKFEKVAKELIQINQNTPSLWLSLAIFNISQCNIIKTRECFKKLVSIAPNTEQYKTMQLGFEYAVHIAKKGASDMSFKNKQTNTSLASEARLFCFAVLDKWGFSS